MNWNRRRLTLQLTPLLDLLLIVIFAQYMEVQETSAQTQQRIEQQTAEQISAVEQQKENQQLTLEATQQQLQQSEKELKTVREEFAQREKDWQKTLKSVLKREEDAGNAISQLFGLPDNFVEKTIDPRINNVSIRSPEEIKKLNEAFQNLAQKRGYDVIKYFLTFEEIRKRCDIWDLHITEADKTLLSTGANSFEFRASDTIKFEAELFRCYKTLSQPKGLVIILLSYDDATLGTVQAAVDALPNATERMRSDSNGRSRFEYTVLGYTPTQKTSDEIQSENN